MYYYIEYFKIFFKLLNILYIFIIIVDNNIVKSLNIMCNLESCYMYFLLELEFCFIDRG